MKAIYFPKYGSTDYLEYTDRPVPEVSPKTILIKVKNSSVNALDWHVMRGIWMVKLKCGWSKPKEKYNVLGADVSGEVIEVGSEVTRFKKGDQVFGEIFTGGFAEYALAEEHQLAIKPDSVSHEQAAAAPVAGLTALKSVKHIVKVKKGDHVLINGASGGVGSFIVQLAKHYGATVTAVCSGKNHDFVKSLGADHVIDYKTTDFCQQDIKYDHVLDVTGNRKPKEMKRILKPGGICAAIGFTTFGLLFRYMLNPSKKIKMVTVDPTTETLTELGELLEKGHIKSAITERFPLSGVIEAIANTSTRRVTGKQLIENEKH